jgi:two-component system NtrC family response regulator
MSFAPLRERDDDARILAEEFLRQFAQQNGKRNLTFAPYTLRAIRSYRWPGNVRKLQNRVQRAVVFAEDGRIGVQDMDLAEITDALPPTTLKEAKERIERDLIERALERHDGRITARTSPPQ